MFSCCPRRAISPNEGFRFPITLLEGMANAVLYCAHRTITCSFQACSFNSMGMGATDLPLRASNEGLRRPRVARAQKIIRPHPLLTNQPLVDRSQPDAPRHTCRALPDTVPFQPRRMDRSSRCGECLSARHRPTHPPRLRDIWHSL